MACDLNMGLIQQTLSRHPNHRKIYLAVCITINLLLLFYFKYFNFIIGSVVKLLRGAYDPLDILLPVGISFYILQALGYSIDVYRGTVKVERNFVRYALFVSFFPQLVAGPIERSSNMLHQIDEVPGHTRKTLLEVTHIRNGLILIIWGLFLKVVIADRVAVFVDEVFGRYTTCGSLVLFLAAMGFLLQLYCDFSSYSIIATGSALLLGFHLMENFHAPLLSHSVGEYWRRWHISLSSWLRDYIYIPLGGSRKGQVKSLRNTMIVFFVSGLWHGADWSFVMWGLIHGGCVSVERMLRPYIAKWNNRYQVSCNSFGFRLLTQLGTFIVLVFSYIFFRAENIRDALLYISLMFTQPDFWTINNDGLFAYGLSALEVFILIVSVVVLLFVDLVHTYKNMRIDEWLSSQWIVFRMVFVVFLVLFTVTYGMYGPGFDSKQFIYFQF